MAYTTIDKPSDYFNTKLYVGDGTSPRSITGIGFQPDLVWTKNRSGTNGHVLFDSVRGVSAGELSTHTNNQEGVAGQYGTMTSFDSDGYSFEDGVTNGVIFNNNTNNYVSWNWLAGGTASSNTDGDITSSVSHNSTSGFSIGTYTGTGTAGDTVGHGLNANPDVLIVKERGNTNSWVFSHKGLTNQSGYVMLLNTTDAQFTDNWFNNTSPTTSVFSTNSTPTNRSGGTYVFYAFAEKKGFSKFGSYIGNSSTDGAFIYTGFKPAFVMTKAAVNTSGTNNWFIADNKRHSVTPASGGTNFNVIDRQLYANLNNADDTNSSIDFLSNGFKWRRDGGDTNFSGRTFVYMAFAETPFVTSTGVPATAR